MNRYSTLLMLMVSLMFIRPIPSFAYVPSVELKPGCGPAGTVVLVKIGPFVGHITKVTVGGTRASFRGMESPFLFTVPRDLAPGVHNVVLYAGDEIVTQARFNVDSVAVEVGPRVDGHEFRIAEDKKSYQVVVYGSGFDTQSILVWDGNDLDTFYPGIVEGRGNEITLAGFRHLDCGGPSGCVQSCYGRVLSAVLPPALADLGKVHGFRVKNRDGSGSSEISVNLPERVVLLEIDGVRGAAELPRGVLFSSSDFPPVFVTRRNEIASVNRIYSDGALLLDIRNDSIEPWLIEHPTRFEVKGPGFTARDLADFFRRTISLKVEAEEAGNWYLHILLVPHFIVEDEEGVTVYGIRVNDSFREGVAVFTSEFTSKEQYIRTLAHEIGHSLNLTHCEGDYLGTTLMNPEERLGIADWTFNFSSFALEHLRAHPENELRPGAGRLSFNSSSRKEGRCTPR